MQKLSCLLILGAFGLMAMSSARWTGWRSVGQTSVHQPQVMQGSGSKRGLDGRIEMSWMPCLTVGGSVPLAALGAAMGEPVSGLPMTSLSESASQEP